MLSKSLSPNEKNDFTFWLQFAISFCRHRSVPALCENGSVEATVAEGGQNPVAGLWVTHQVRVDHLSLS